MLHHYKACELESSNHNLFHEMNMSNEIFRKLFFQPPKNVRYEYFAKPYIFESYL